MARQLQLNDFVLLDGDVEDIYEIVAVLNKEARNGQVVKHYKIRKDNARGRSGCIEIVVSEFSKRLTVVGDKEAEGITEA
jgi:hypothetical protein